jgi:hypothetical protein
VCVDECTAAASEQFKNKPFAFTLKTAKGREYHFAAENAETRGKWLTSVGNASYTNMYQRTREAVKFLDRCKELVAPFVVSLHLAEQEREDGEGEAGANPDVPLPLFADVSRADDGDIAEAKASMSGADVIAALSELQGAQTVASSSGRAFRERIVALEKEAAALRSETEAARKAAADAAALRAKADDLAARNVELQTRVEGLNKDLSLSMAAAAKATRLVAGGAGGAAAAAAAAKGVDEDLLRARVRELEAQMAREREEAGAALRAAQAAAAQAAQAAAAAQTAASARSPVSAAAAGIRGGGPAATPVSPKLAAPATATPGGGASSLMDASIAFEHEWQPFLTEAQRLEREGK